MLAFNSSVGACRNDTTQAAGLLSRSRDEPLTQNRHEHPGHSMASVADVRACLELCQQCSQCRAISVSTTAGVCIWFKTRCRVVTYAEPNSRKYGVFKWLDDFATVSNLSQLTPRKANADKSDPGR